MKGGTVHRARNRAPRATAHWSAHTHSSEGPDVCAFCDLDPWAEGVTGCEQRDINYEGRMRPRVIHTWDADLGIPDDNPCKCGAYPHNLHHYGCSLEICPWADEHIESGHQLLFCGWYP